MTDSRTDERPVGAIVVGGSAGALTILKGLIAALPVPLTVPLLAVLHIREDRSNLLVEVLGRSAPVPVCEPEDKEVLVPGHVYVAPPGYHLLVEDEHTLALSVDPPQHYSRPSIDVLFESAAAVFGAALVGVLLSGASADGAAGIKAIHDAGGLTIVQTPASSVHATMPEAALSMCTPSMLLAPLEIEQTLARLARSAILGARGRHA